jgi:hypothetical protein
LVDVTRPNAALSPTAVIASPIAGAISVVILAVTALLHYSMLPISIRDGDYWNKGTAMYTDETKDGMAADI